MIIMIIQDNMNGLNTDKATYTYLIKRDVAYCGDILYPRQIDDLKIHGSTTINSQIVNQLSESIILDEVKRLTGINCKIRKTNYGYLLEKVKGKKSKLL